MPDDTRFHRRAGTSSISTELAVMLMDENIDVVIANAEISRNNITFQPEPILIKAQPIVPVFEYYEKDIQRNKFIDKPLHNYKR